MTIESDRIVPFVIMWGIPIFIVMRTYLKMDEEDKKSAKRDFKKPFSIFTLGFIVIGAFLAQIASILSIEILNVAGTIILAVGGGVTAVDSWRSNNKWGSIYVSVLILGAIYFLYR
ncbi:hypothetical protein [Radiobacillus deserti]|uniref:hypothetical protein n=1 Tax=Radiobacillus deserti TaxID=2594883 RepID=UPI001315667A|nr:hypothetical protein [Radiobacillus deserti]